MSIHDLTDDDFEKITLNLLFGDNIRADDNEKNDERNDKEKNDKEKNDEGNDNEDKKSEVLSIQSQLLASLLQENINMVTPDYMTGFYLSKLITWKNIYSFHMNLSNKRFFAGLYKGIIQYNKRAHWTFYGCDNKIINGLKHKYLNKERYDLLDINSVRSLGNNISDTIGKKTVNLFTSIIDYETIKTNNSNIIDSTMLDLKKQTRDFYTVIILRQFTMMYEFIHSHGMMVFTLPQLTKNTIMLLVFFISYYDVKIMKTPWSEQNYLILSNRRCPINNKILQKLSEYNGDVYLLNDVIYQIVDKDNNKFIDLLTNKVKKTLTDVTSYDFADIFNDCVDEKPDE